MVGDEVDILRAIEPIVNPQVSWLLQVPTTMQRHFEKLEDESDAIFEHTSKWTDSLCFKIFMTLMLATPSALSPEHVANFFL